MTEYTYSCVLHETHWFVVTYGQDIEGIELITTDRGAALTALYSFNGREAVVQLQRFDTVFAARCGTCGDYTGGLPWYFRTWDELVDDVCYTSGWGVYEQLVLCNYHQPL